MIFDRIRQIAKTTVRVWRRRANQKIVPLLSTISVGGFILTILALWGFIELADEVLAKQTVAIDKQIMLLVKSWHSPWLDAVMKVFSVVGGTLVVTLFSLGVGAWLWRKKRWTSLKAFAITAIGGTSLNLLAKQFVERDRPHLWETGKSGALGTSSFPSGHAMLSLVIYGFVVYLLARRYKRWRWWMIGGTTILVLLIGFSRIYVGIHWPTDIVAAYAAGIAWLASCILGFEVRQSYKEIHRNQQQK